MSALTDAYVAAVAANLPRKTRDDIAAELTDVLLMKVEAREEELGRPLNRADEEALLKAFGHPLKVAGRYGKNQYLIGPAIYPFYIFALKVAAGIVVVLWLVAAALTFVFNNGHWITPSHDLQNGPLTIFAVITIICIILDRTGSGDRLAQGWKASQLPMLGAPKARSGWEVLGEMAATTIAILWWVGLFHVPNTGPRGFEIHMAAVWHQMFWPILIYMLAQIPLNVFELMMPGMVRAVATARGAYYMAGIGLAWVIYQAGHWIDITSTTDRADVAARMDAGFNNGFQIGFLAVIVILAIQIGVLGWRFMRASRPAYR